MKSWGVELSPEGKTDDPRVKKIKESILRGMEQEMEKETAVSTKLTEPETSVKL